MSELRRDPITNRWVVIAEERGKRPNFLKQNTEVDRISDLDPDPNCPFCPGNENPQDPEFFAIGPPQRLSNDPNWEVRVIPNRYPIFDQGLTYKRRGYGLYDHIAGVGIHELVIEHPSHLGHLADFSVLEVQKILQAYRSRLSILRENPNLRYILVFRNYRKEAGASMQHPHSQIIGTPITPLLVKEKLKNAQTYFMDKERCLLCDLIWQESDWEKRVVIETDEYIVFCPFASSFPFEVWLCPKHHCHDFSLLTDMELIRAAAVLRELMQRMKRTLDDPPYNFILNTAPVMHERFGRPNYWKTLQYDFHWYLELIPRLTTIAGFEWGSNFYVNPISPEQAAQELRGDVVRG